MNKTLHIAVDMDDVVVDFVGGLCAAIRTEYDIELYPEDITQWDLQPILDPIIGRNWWAWLREREWLWANFGVVPGALGSIDLLRREGHYMELVTSKPLWAEHNVWKWLGKWRPAFQQVTVTNPDHNKADWTDADIIIDDKMENCAGFIATGRKAILFTRPHNANQVLIPPLHRATGWHEVRAIIREISNEQS